MSGAAGPVSGSANIRLQGEIPSMAEWIHVVSGKPEAQQSSKKERFPRKQWVQGYSIHPSEIPGYFR